MHTSLFAALVGLVSLVACGRSEPVTTPAAPEATAPAAPSAAEDATTPAADVAAAATDVALETTSAAEVAAAPRSARADLAACKATQDVATCIAAGDAYSPVSGAIARSAYTIACSKGSSEACIALAAEERDLDDSRDHGIHAEATLPRVDPVATSTRACELGDWRACSWIADRSRDVGCNAGGYALNSVEEQPDAAVREKFDALTATHADKACDGGDRQACELVAWRSLGGCGMKRDPAHGLERLGKILAPEAAKCSPTDLGACHEVRYRCDWAREALGSDAPTPGTTAQAKVVSATASSVLPPWKGYRFTASQLIDGDLATSWQPLDKKRGGVGQWFELRLAGPTRLAAVEIANGLQKVDDMGDLFLKNNRILYGTIELDDGSRTNVALAADQRGFVTVPVNGTSSYVRVVVDAITRGSEWNDLAVSEVRVLAKGAPLVGAVTGLPDVCARPLVVADEACRAGVIKGCEMVIANGSADAKKAALEAASKLTSGACEAGDKDPRSCIAAASYALALDPAAPAGRALTRRACKLGDTGACGALGCHQKEGEADALDGNPWDERFTRADAAECQAICDEGDDASCLVLGGAIAYDVAGLDFGAPHVKQVFTRVAASCKDADACETLAFGFEPDPNERAPLDLVTFIQALAAYERACELGAGSACTAAANKIADWSAKSPRLEVNERRACELGDVEVCHRLKISGGDVAAAYERAYASTLKTCEGGDSVACFTLIQILKHESDNMELRPKNIQGPKPDAEIARLTKVRHEQLARACEGGDIEACRNGADRGQGMDPDPVLSKRELALAVGLCLDDAQRDRKENRARIGTLCAPLCQTADALGIGSLTIDGAAPSPDKFAPLAELAPELTPELLLDTCIEVQLEDPCSCGCC